MKFSKIKAAALILVLFICAAYTFSCADKNKEETNSGIPTEEKTAENEQTATSEPEAVNSVGSRPDYDLPAQDFNGYNFRLISRGETVQHWWNLDISADEENGDLINDGVFQRNRKIEEKYNIKIVNIPDGEVSGKANKSIKAGSDDYDVVVIGLPLQGNLSVSGLLMDLHRMPFIDLTKPWWDQKAVEQLSVEGKLYATACDLTIRDKDAIIILMFSKTLAQNYGIEDPYQLVLSGNWTIDKMYDMVKSASKDLDGDGVMGLGDQYGFLTQYRHTQYLFNGCGEYIAKLSAEKLPEITLYNERSSDICDKIALMQADKNITVNAEQASGKFTDIWDVFQVPLFAEDRALFYHAGMNRVTLLRTMETDFGILPTPKYDETQENYHIAVDAACMSSVSVPITVSDPERTGQILEDLTYESRYILLPAYYDMNLKTKFARDEESSAMIDIILTNRLYDLGEIYGWGSVVNYFNDLAQGKNTSLATYWEKNEAKIESAMRKTMDKLSDLD